MAEELPLVQALRDAIQKALKEGRSLGDIARSCELTHPQLSRFLRGERSLTLETAAKLYAHFGLKGPPNLKLVKVSGYSLPLCGKVSAGRPAAVIEPDVERFEFEKRLGPDDERFMLEVEGDSMIEDHVAPGDYIIIRTEPEAKSGERVVVTIDGEPVLKVYVESRGKKYLAPCNSKMQPIPLTPDHENNIVGVVVAVLRMMGRVKRGR